MSQFNEVPASKSVLFDIYRPFLQCFDISEAKFKGNLDSSSFDRMSIEFIVPEKECRNDPYDSQCVTKAEYEKKLGNLMIGLLTNQMRFD